MHTVLDSVLANASPAGEAGQSLQSAMLSPEGGQILEALMENISALVFWKDDKLVYRGCNYSFARALGFDHPGQVLGSTDADIIAEAEQAQAYIEVDTEVLTSNLPYVSHDFVSRVPGKPEGQWVRTYKYPLRDANGTVSGILGIVCEDRQTVYLPGFHKQG
ncbi:MAG: PAS domain-containing protein [Bacteroidetes bacterium]|nr:PAS domain-containing protein [Bacteroidota bacterium]